MEDGLEVFLASMLSRQRLLEERNIRAFVRLLRSARRHVRKRSSLPALVAGGRRRHFFLLIVILGVGLWGEEVSVGRSQRR